MCLREEEGGPLYRKQKGGKSHIKPMWDSYLEKNNIMKKHEMAWKTVVNITFHHK